MSMYIIPIKGRNSGASTKFTQVDKLIEIENELWIVASEICYPQCSIMWPEIIF